MVKNINHSYTNSTLVASQFLVDAESFAVIKNKVTEEFLANVDVPGFRKGKAPVEKAMEKVNHEYMLNSIYQEVIFSNYAESEKSIRDHMEKEGRKILSIGISNKSEDVFESDKGFTYTLVTNILPKINLDKVATIEIKNPVEADIQNRLTIDQVVEKEGNTLIKMFGTYEASDKAATGSSRVTCDIIEFNSTDPNAKPVEDKASVINLGTGQFPADFENNIIGIKADETKKFNLKINTDKGEQEFQFTIAATLVEELKKQTLQDLFDTDEKMTKAFGSVEQFNQGVKDRFNTETTNVLGNVKTRVTLEAINEQYSDVEIDLDAVKNETTRILGEVNKEASPVEHFNQLNLIYTKPATDKTLEAEITKYVTGEFIMSKILLVTYFDKVEEKITDEEIQNNSAEIMKNPAQYGYPANIDEKALKDQIFDRLLNYKATQWLIKNIKSI